MFNDVQKIMKKQMTYSMEGFATTIYIYMTTCET